MHTFKKFGFGAIVAALFAVLAMATLVSTTYAAALAAGTEVQDDAGNPETTFEVDDEGVIVVETAADNTAVIISQNTASTGAVEFSSGATALVTTEDDGGGDFFAEVGRLVKGRDGNWVRSPLWLLRRDAEKTVTELAAQLGLSPTARARAGVRHETAVPKEVAKVDPQVADFEAARRKRIMEG